MKLQKLHIKNFKSIVDLEIVEPNPFTVFVGPNGSGKSNIFEALEFVNYLSRFMISDAVQFFGGKKNVLNINNAIQKIEAKGVFDDDRFDIAVDLGDAYFFSGQRFPFPHKQGEQGEFFSFPNSFKQFFKKFSRIFIKSNLREFPFSDDTKLNVSTSNLEEVLRRILDSDKNELIIEWLELLIPEFANIEIIESESGNYRLRVYERYAQIPLEKNLLSDGTYNILALLTAVYQSDEPQFLCIEEPENGLHPQVIRELVSFFREACQNGHYIWLNTHSQTLVDCLTTDEIILVDKIKGETQIKQLKGRSLNNMPASELWLSGALGGGVTW